MPGVHPAGHRTLHLCSVLLAHTAGASPGFQQPRSQALLGDLDLNSGGVLAAGEGCLLGGSEWGGQAWGEREREGRGIRSRSWKFASWP